MLNKTSAKLSYPLSNGNKQLKVRSVHRLHHSRRSIPEARRCGDTGVEVGVRVDAAGLNGGRMRAGVVDEGQVQ